MAYGNQSITDETRDVKQRDITPESIGFISTYVLVSLIGIVFNVITILIIIYGKKFGKSIKPQLLSIAVADLLSAVMIPTSVVFSAYYKIAYPQSDSLCKVHLFLTSTSFYASLLSNAVAGIERLIAVYFPFRMVYYKKRHVYLVITASWIAAGIFHVDNLIFAEIVPNPISRHTSQCSWVRTPITISVLLITQATKIMLPTTIIFVVYSALFVKMCQKKRARNTHNSSFPAMNNQVHLYDQCMCLNVNIMCVEQALCIFHFRQSIYFVIT